MFDRVRGLFSRYADHHLTVTAPGHALPDSDGKPLGYLDSASAHGNRLRFEGWTTADQLILTWEGGQIAQRPHLRREDVDAIMDTGPDVGFSIEAPMLFGSFVLTLRFGGAGVDCRVQGPSRRAIKRARHRLALRFAWDMIGTMPAVIGWLVTNDPSYRARIKTRLDLDAVPLAGPMPPDLFLDTPDTPVQAAAQGVITIVLPVYNAFDLLEDVLHRVEAHTDLPWRLVLIEDCSTDQRVRPLLRDWVNGRSDRVQLLENAENQGFIRSVNQGLDLALDWGNHVVLLNSDAFVPQAWASRLLAPLDSHENVASVTPMSNDAEIFSVPSICTRTPLAVGEGDAIDRVARRINSEAALSVAPTGVGFCMAMHIDYLRQIPTLDTIFGRGYGEEVDWCQKTRALGGRHLGMPGVFVEHRGGESFGSDEKQALIRNNNAVVAHRYPTYDRDV